MAKFKKIIDAQDNKPVFVNPDQVKVVFQYNDSKEACILLEGKTVLSLGYHVSVNAEVSDIIEYLEDKTEELKYFSDSEEQNANPVEEEQHEVPLYRVLINCKNVNAVNCAVEIMAKNAIIENSNSAKVSAMRDILGPLTEDVYSWFTVQEGLTKAEAQALHNDFVNSTCINAKIEEM